MAVALEAVQEELLSLKQTYQQRLHLKKAPAGSAASPFPLVISLTTEPPESAEAYDISTLKVAITLNREVLQGSCNTKAVNITVVSSELPQDLCRAIGQTLRSQWEEQFQQAEPYQSVNTDGATVRRYTIINNDHEQQGDVSLSQLQLPAASSVPSQPPGFTPQPDRQQKADHQARCPSSQHHTSSTQGADALNVSDVQADAPTADRQVEPRRASSNLAIANLSMSTQAAIKYMQRRYGDLMILPNAIAATGTRQQGSQDGQHAASDRSAVCQILFGMQPTDPSWDTKQASMLNLVAELGPLYPQKGSFSLRLASNQAHLSDAACHIINHLIAAEAAQHAGRNTAMQQLLRFVDNRAGMLVHEAEDICLEAARRRGQTQLKTQSEAEHESAAELPRQPPCQPFQTVHAGNDAAYTQSAQQPPNAAGHDPQQLHVDPPVSDTDNHDSQKRPMHQAPPPPGGGNAPSLHHPDSKAAGVAETSMLDAQQDTAPCGASPAADVATDLHGLHVTDANEAVDFNSEQDSEATADESWWDSSASYSDNAPHSSSFEDSEVSTSDADADPHDQTNTSHNGTAAGNNSDVADTGSLQLELQGLSLDNVDALEALKLNIQMVCSRCPSTADMSFASDAVASGSQQGPSGMIQGQGTCSNCHLPWTASLKPRLVHAHSNVLASIKAEGCHPLDLLPSLMGAQCGNCSAAVSLRSTQVGVPCNRQCSACYTQLGLVFQSAAFVLPPRSAAQNTSARRYQRNHDHKQGHGRNGASEKALVLGEPLPDLGTCKHYHHSHRWLRFPCCGRRFACDLCHEEGTDGHEMKWAQRMLCGYCSKEQPLGEQCSNCGKRIARSARGAIGAATHHWQGGEGCRDKKFMDRRDAAKYRNSKNKSVSKKSARVGKEGAVRRKQRGQKADK